MQRTKWFERTFPAIEDNGLLPVIIERLEGTPARVKDKIEHLPGAVNNQPILNKWSIKKEIGHLSDLEPLWYERLLQIIGGEADMKKADLTNRKTEEAPHDNKSFEELIDDLRTQRQKLVTRLRALSDGDLEKSAIHPRLKTPMRVIDLAFFVAEHDDHHLAQITHLAYDFS